MEAAEKLQAEEAARKQRFSLLHSTFAKEKAVLQATIDDLSSKAHAHSHEVKQHREVTANEKLSPERKVKQCMARECA